MFDEDVFDRSSGLSWGQVVVTGLAVGVAGYVGYSLGRQAERDDLRALFDDFDEEEFGDESPYAAGSDVPTATDNAQDSTVAFKVA